MEGEASGHIMHETFSKSHNPYSNYNIYPFNDLQNWMQQHTFLYPSILKILAIAHKSSSSRNTEASQHVTYSDESTSNSGNE